MSSAADARSDAPENARAASAPPAPSALASTVRLVRLPKRSNDISRFLPCSHGRERAESSPDCQRVLRDCPSSVERQRRAGSSPTRAGSALDRSPMIDTTPATLAQSVSGPQRGSEMAIKAAFDSTTSRRSLLGAAAGAAAATVVGAVARPLVTQAVTDSVTYTNDQNGSTVITGKSVK